jgi:hypothetical protein
LWAGVIFAAELDVRVHVLNGTLEDAFRHWRKGFRHVAETRKSNDMMPPSKMQRSLLNDCPQILFSSRFGFQAKLGYFLEVVGSVVA